MSQQRLVNKLQQNVAGLNTEFDRNHQDLTDEILDLKESPELHDRTVRRLVGAKGLTEPMIEYLGKISNIVKKLKQMEKDYVQNRHIMGRVRSMNMERIDKNLNLHRELMRKINDLVTTSDNNRNSGRYVEYNHDLGKITDQFQTTLEEIKDAKEYINNRLKSV